MRQRKERFYVEMGWSDARAPIRRVREDLTLAAARRFCRGKYGQRFVIRAQDGTAVETWANDHSEPGEAQLTCRGRDGFLASAEARHADHGENDGMEARNDS